ncbi:MAG: GGDEF domain-containing protein [Aquabacterium sp.]|uniref:GGDEF domain-containing protein n=1 Tax=Aquabacterium sp. TaxID=1872578 RepID=UPI0011FC15D9|nr:GGDEF domain-containing protein [Aquabacterium sp.]TAK94634.1 MAG: GGDEF domain-containing protein [Aquabacterium sp.]
MTLSASSLTSTCQPELADRDVEELRRRGLKRFWLAWPAYVAVLVLLCVGVYVGSVKSGVAMLISVGTVLSLGLIYLTLRMGWAVRSQDPMLAFTQSSFSIALVAIGYAMLDDLRSTALLWLSVIVVFDLWRLPRRQVRLAMVMCLVLPMLATVSRYYWHPEPMNWVHELFTLLILAVVLPVLYAVSGQARAARSRHARQKQQMAETLARLHEFSIRDGLTGLYNRRHMLTLLEDETRRSRRNGRPFTLALLDLDFFKHVNDEHGHATGDIVLKTFARIARDVLPDSADMLGRWGGEEFLLLQSETDAAQALADLNRLRQACREHEWSQYAPGLRVTFSAGVCQHQRQDQLDHSLELADRALYQAKAEGRDRVSVHGGVDLALVGVDGIAGMSRRLERGPSVAAASCAPASDGATWTDLVMDDLDEKVSALDKHEPAHGWRHRLLNLLCGSNQKLRPAMAMCVLSLCVYLTSIAGFMFYVMPSGLLTRVQGMGFVLHNILAIVVPFVLLRSGVTVNWKDPSFVMPQVLWGGTGVIIGYGMMPTTSPSTLQMICLSLVFGFTSLKPLQAVWVGRYYLAMMLGVWVVRALSDVVGFMPRREGLEVAMTCLVLWILTLQSTRLSAIRLKVRAEKRELIQATERVSQVMVRDTLTDLFNRQYMQILLDRECVRHQRSGKSFSVALIDLDHFKAINDTYGHGVGDEVLVGFAQAARNHLRDSDVLCRWGGEEFLVLLVGADPGANGVMAMGRLRDAMASHDMTLVDSSLKVTFSAGVAEHLPGEPIARTLQRADEALYAAKAAGRDRCELAA